MSAVVTPEHQPQRERAGDLRGQRRVAAHQHQAQHVVVDEVPGVGPHRPERLRSTSASTTSSGACARRHRLGPQPVEHPAPGGGHQPGRGPVRHAVARPGARRRLDGIRQRVLDEVEPAELREEQGDQAAPLLAHRRRERLVGRHCGSYPSILITGRTSTV